jgi:glycosyltransferase involved in cell wall biosynthesis
MDVAAVRRSLIDVKEMADAFQYYYDNPDIRRKHGKNARRWTERHCDIRVIEKKWNDLIKNTLNSD